MLVVSTVHCTCTFPSACSARTPAKFMEQYDSHRGTGPVNISVKIGDLNQAQNSPRTFSEFHFLNRTFPNEACNPGVCNNTCGFQPPSIFRDFVLQYGRANCPWNYICDFDPHRIPQYLYLAECMELGTLSSSSSPSIGVEVYYPIPVLRTVEPSCDPLNSTTTTWKWDVQVIPVACVCSRQS